MKIRLPKQDADGRYAFSYSQYKKWKNGPKDYIRSYFFKEPFLGNAYTEFGNKVGEALEKGDFSEFSRSEQEVLKKASRLGQYEKRVELDFGDFYLLGFIDSCDGVDGSPVTRILDYKTGGPGKESEYDPEGYDQVALYAAAIEQEQGSLPKKAWVEFMLREGNPFKGEELRLGTQEPIIIPQPISKKRVEAAKERVRDVAEEIHHCYAVFEKLNKPLEEVE